MKHLSVFVDESGDFGQYDYHSPYYIVTFVFHDQSDNIMKGICHLDNITKKYNLPNIIHTGPLIRGEHEYRNMIFEERKSVFDSLFYFICNNEITYHTIAIEKKQLTSENNLQNRISKQLTNMLNEKLIYFIKYDCVEIYYDSGQKELTNIIKTVFEKALNRVEYKKVVPKEYKLLQVADMLCMIELLKQKAETKTMSKSELSFFESARSFTKSYLKAILKKRL